MDNFIVFLQEFYRWILMNSFHNSSIFSENFYVHISSWMHPSITVKYILSFFGKYAIRTTNQSQKCAFVGTWCCWNFAILQLEYSTWKKKLGVSNNLWFNQKFIAFEAELKLNFIVIEVGIQLLMMWEFNCYWNENLIVIEVGIKLLLEWEFFLFKWEFHCNWSGNLTVSEVGISL